MQEFPDSRWVSADLSLRTRNLMEVSVDFMPEMEYYFAALKKNLGVDVQTFPSTLKDLFGLLEDKGFNVFSYTRKDLGYTFNPANLARSEQSKTILNKWLDYIGDNIQTLVLEHRK
jgi:hypothetical protein